MKNGIHFGNDIDFSKVNETLPNLTQSILSILNTSAGDSVKHKALDVIRGFTSCDITGATVSNCHISIQSDDGSSD